MAQKQQILRTATYCAGGAIAIIVISVTFLFFDTIRSSKTTISSPTAPPIRAVTALGRVEPQGSVIKLSVANATDSRVDRLLVKEGDEVEAGQIIAILQGLDKQQAEVLEAEQNLTIQQVELAQVLAGEKPGDIAAQQAVVERIQAQVGTQSRQNQAAIDQTIAKLENAQAEYVRYFQLYQAGAISASELDSKEEAFETAKAELNEAKAQSDNTIVTLYEQFQEEQARLSSLMQIRPVDIQLAQAEVNYALTQLEKAKAELGDYYVRVPVSGQILRINTQVGEQVDPDEGIVDLGQTDKMYVIAEVYETDVTRVAVGQRATMNSENGGFSETLHGTVEFISPQIKKQDILDSDPATDVDARVVEVKIRLDSEDSQQVSTLTNLKVRVDIKLN